MRASLTSLIMASVLTSISAPPSSGSAWSDRGKGHYRKGSACQKSKKTKAREEKKRKKLARKQGRH